MNEERGENETRKAEGKIMKMYANMCELLHCCEAEHDIKTAKGTYTMRREREREREAQTDGHGYIRIII
jgi:hypothetical protein